MLMPLKITDVVPLEVLNSVAPPGKAVMDILGGDGSWKAVYKHSQAQQPYNRMGDDVTYWWTYFDYGLPDGNPRKRVLGLLGQLGIEKKLNALGQWKKKKDQFI